MFKKLLAEIGILGMAASPVSALEPNWPYQDGAINQIYHLLFCDQLKLFQDGYKGEITYPWSIVFSGKPDYSALRRIAENPKIESRVRVLAFNRLRSGKQIVKKKVLLGTVIEVALPAGLDTLAVFTDGSARYINHSGKIAIVEGTPNEFQAEIDSVIAASKPIVSVIGPWDKERLRAPRKDNIRMTFIVSDGLYFGEGPMDQMQKDQMAAPLIAAATKLLTKIVDKTTNSERGGAANRP